MAEAVGALGRTRAPSPLSGVLLLGARGVDGDGGGGGDGREEQSGFGHGRVVRVVVIEGDIGHVLMA